MKEPILGLALICLTYSATETTTWAGCGSRIDGNDDPDCKVASNLGTAGTTKDIARPVAQWSVGGRPKCVTVAQCAQLTALDNAADAIEDATKTVENDVDHATNAIADAVDAVADTYANRAQNQVEASYGINCAIGSDGYALATINAGIVSASAPFPIDRGASLVGLAASGLTAVMLAHEVQGRCERR